MWLPGILRRRAVTSVWYKMIAGLNVGDKVKVAWFYDERKRTTQIQVTAKAKGEASSEKGEK